MNVSEAAFFIGGVGLGFLIGAFAYRHGWYVRWLEKQLERGDTK